MHYPSPKIGLALGSGSARGWAHIGVIRTLRQAGIVPDIICGTSIGAVVGAAHAVGRLDALEDWVRQLTWQTVVGLLDLKLDGGLIEGSKLLDALRALFRDEDIARLPNAFGAVATELLTGREVWLREGSLIAAMRASMAMPGLFTPARVDGRVLVDGGLVNPVPVSLCRAMGADIVIAVDLNWDLIERHQRMPASASNATEQALPGPLASILDKLPEFLSRLGGDTPPPDEMPSMLEVLGISLNIMQVRITRSRLAGEPADAMIRPRLASLALMDFHRAAVAIAEGERAAALALPHLNEVLGPGMRSRE